MSRCQTKVHILDIHQNPNDNCIVGHHIQPVLSAMFVDMEDTFAKSLAGKTLADCITDIKKECNNRRTHMKTVEIIFSPTGGTGKVAIRCLLQCLRSEVVRRKLPSRD